MFKKNIDQQKSYKIAKMIFNNFLSTLISEESLKKLGNFYPTVESRRLLREWFTLQILLMIISISSFYKEDSIEDSISLDIAKKIFVH